MIMKVCDFYLSFAKKAPSPCIAARFTRKTHQNDSIYCYYLFIRVINAFCQFAFFRFFLTLKFITSWQAVLRGSKHPVPRVASFRVVARQQQRTAVNKMMYRAPPLIETAAPWRCFVGETFQWNISEFKSTRLACFRNDSKRKGACAACGCRVASSCIIVLQFF